MKKPNINLSEFIIKEKIVNNEKLTLICSKFDTNWNKDNLIFRSSLWNSNNELISAGLPKFFNFGENCQLSPVPETLENCNIVEKIDGSLLIVSKYNGHFILRTRELFDVKIFNNEKDILILNKKYPSLYKSNLDTLNFSLLFEWVTPSNKIILNYNEVDFILVGAIDHSNYKLFTQAQLNQVAKYFKFKRPQVYSFNTIEELKSNVSSMVSHEGIVLYSNDDQTLHKVKSQWYLYLHSMKNDLTSIKNVINLFFELKCPLYNDFYEYIKKECDYEIAEYCKDNLKYVCDKYQLYLMKKAEIEKYVKNIRHYSRKEIASLIMQKGHFYKTFAFTILDNKEVPVKSIKDNILLF